MIDLETLSTRPHAAVLTIGAIKFSLNGSIPRYFEEKKLNTFYRRINIESCKKINLHIDQATQRWWARQGRKAREEALDNPDRVDLQDALKDFAIWLNSDSDTRVWGNGSDFDITILGEMYKRCGMEIPWRFWQSRDVRTVMELSKKISGNDINISQSNKHHALYDCHRQIFGLQKALRLMKNK
jgi:exodeoxyribonuclease VIII